MEIALNASQLLFALIAVAAVLIGVIFFMKYYIKSRAASKDFASSYEEKDRIDQLKARTKYPEVDGLGYSNTFLNFGLAAAILVSILVLNYTEYEKNVTIHDVDWDIDDEFVIEPPRTQEPPPPPPPPPPPKIEEVSEEILEEEDQDLFKDQTIFEDTEVAEVEVKEEAPPPPPPPPKKEEKTIFRRAEQMPRFPGCEDINGTNEEKYECAQQKLLQFVYSNIRYPTIAKETQTEGTVYAQFVVTDEGDITDIKILRDPGAGLGDEAKRVVEKMKTMPQKWTPGRQRGKPVSVMFNLPIKFQLE